MRICKLKKMITLGNWKPKRAKLFPSATKLLLNKVVKLMKKTN